MDRISSSATFFHKRVFPAIWFGFLVVFVVMAVTLSAKGQSAPPVMFFVGPVLMAVFGFFAMKRLVFDLADEVLDGGDYLDVRFGGETQRIPLAEIINVGWTSMMNPSRVVLTLRTAGRFGREIAFFPRRGKPWTGSRALVSGLIDRIDAARRR